jgi:hypothetical protein
MVNIPIISTAKGDVISIIYLPPPPGSPAGRPRSGTPKLPRVEKHVLQALYQRDTDPAGAPEVYFRGRWSTLQHLSKETGYKLSTIDEALWNLEDKGLADFNYIKEETLAWRPTESGREMFR